MDNHVQDSLKSAPPLVSWLLCTNREDALLYRAIDSCLAQTFSGFELVLVVNGELAEPIATSVREMYKSDCRVRVLATSIRLLNFSLSLGLHTARGQFIARMDADDVSAPQRLERQLAFLESRPDVVVCGSSYLLIDADGLQHGAVDLPRSDDEIRTALHYRNPICHPSVIFRRAPVLALGGYLGGQNAEDYDLWLRIAATSTWNFANLPEYLLSYNMDPNGAARGSRNAYANVAAAQLRSFLLTGTWRWLLGCLLSCSKFFIRAKKI